MFICQKCLDEGFENGSGVMQSRGCCELCNTVELCWDIPSKFLIRKGEDDDI